MEATLIRQANPDDLDFLAQMVVLTTRPIARVADREPGEVLTIARLEVSQWLTEPHRAFLGWQGANRVGAVWLRGAGEATARIYTLGLAVGPAYQRQGVGTALLQYGLDFCRQHGGSQARLQVHPTNQAALNLYRRFGFEAINIEMRLGL